jgi:hypothetical protein
MEVAVRPIMPITAVSTAYKIYRIPEIFIKPIALINSAKRLDKVLLSGALIYTHILSEFGVRD